ncbi:hypothetical protein PIB30_098543 [Stylosanthes scabra]|uniref:Uncharacterized protein n=1 Tax=Stylosanthes scabra TaxID=79078 RepID=A0ABU6VWH8_9FABA|nr:hypothetical protein [Stylosanthes scabra]
MHDQFREKGKEVITSDVGGQRHMKKYRAKPGNMYIVEMPKDSEEGEEEVPNQMQLEMMAQQGMELAIYMESALNLKRKWKEEMSEQMEKDNKTNNIGEQAIEKKNKKRKEEAKYTKAEEADLTMPHPKP